MSFQNWGVNLRAFLPKDLHDSLICYTFVNSTVVDGAPDITACSSNGYLYEVKNKKILRSLNIDNNPSSIQCHYLLENEKLVVFYIVHTRTYKLLVIKSANKHLKVVKLYEQVKMFQVYDFNCFGFPQMKIFFLNEPEALVCEFPVIQSVEPELIENESPIAKSLNEDLEELHKYTDELAEEFNQLKKICFSDELTDTEGIFVGTINFSALLNKAVEYKLTVCNKWVKVFGNNLILGMTFCNTGQEIIRDLEVIINHRDVTDYAFSFFQSAKDIGCCLFSSLRVNCSVKPREEICAVGTFEVPEFSTESSLSIPCYVSHGDLKDCLLKETFEMNICDIAAQSTVGLEDRFTVEDLLAIKVSKSETGLKIQTEDLEDGFIESILMNQLGFKMIRHVKDKIFYCTSTYLKEVFVMLQHIAVNPSVWKLAMYTSNERQIYFIVTALYDLLPENTAILWIENEFDENAK